MMAANKALNGQAPECAAFDSLGKCESRLLRHCESCFPVVGIGASAGGLAAFEAFFSGMPSDVDPNMAFVLVQHLAPDHKSILTALIQRYTRMHVFEVEDGMKVEINCAYIIPPNRDMAFLDGSLHLFEPTAPRGQRLPIDYFFRSLAQDQHDRAIGIVLSGTGSDGTSGVRAIKGEGGMVMVQDPASTEFDGMPRNAIATGLVDFELPPAKMPAQIIAFVGQALGMSPRADDMPKPALTENVLKKIFVMLRSQTGHDFSKYKPSTINRRIGRRMAVHQVDSMESYVRLLQQSPPEVDALFRDLLIGVTNFFRDSAAFSALEARVIPKLFEGKAPGSLVRVWTPGCSTGEEAYSVAILLHEHLDTLRQNFKVQIFATDIDGHAITTARNGLYPASISADISQERLARFFSAESDGSAYRVHKCIRDLLIFSEQNVIKDPPFSRLDLISCRNLLIYLDVDLQKKLIPLFHYALKPHGFLFLGTSETVGEFSDLFTMLERKLKIYQRKEDVLGARRTSFGQFLPPLAAPAQALPQHVEKADASGKLPLREITEQAILQQLSPVAALVNAQGVIFYLHGRSGPFLELAPGEIGVANILKMAREKLRRNMTTALHKAAGTKEVVSCHNIRIKSNDTFMTVNLTVRPITTSLKWGLETPLYLIMLEAVHSGNDHAESISRHHSKGDNNLETAAGASIAALKQELLVKEEYLQTTNEELETSNEELKSSNEEMQSINEELQSTNEELETSKEELQSVNEELSTVNAELQAKVADLSRTNNDMNNLLAGTGIATVFVDYQLCILRFTPATTRIINLILSDVGRPVGHIVSNLVGYDTLAADAQSVLDTLIPKELDVQTIEGKWYSMHIRPYRTLDNVIEGAVITFVDITQIKASQQLLMESDNEVLLVSIVRDSKDAILTLDMDGRILSWNNAASRLFGWIDPVPLTMNIRDIVPVESRETELDNIMRTAKSVTGCVYSTRRVARGGRIFEVWLTATLLVDNEERVYGVATSERAGPMGGDTA